MAGFIRATIVILFTSLIISLPDTAISFVFFDKKKSDSDYDFQKPQKPVIEALDHMPEGERKDWYYSLYHMDEPEESIFMFEQTTRRYPVPIDESSENITIITRRRIERMNAHSVAEILSRVCGVFVDSGSGELGASSFISIENSDARHVRVMIDGISINNLSNGHAETKLIPVGIIDRIEVLKGPASSVWGSSLGGVVNIITRVGGEDLDKPASAVTTTYGENNTLDFRASLSKKFNERISILANASKQKSDGIIHGRAYEKESLFLKLYTGKEEASKLSFTSLASQSTTDEPNSTQYNEDSETDMDVFLTSFNIEMNPHKKFTLSLSGFHFQNNFDTDISTPGYNANDIFDDTSTGISGQIHIHMWGLSTTTLGFDYADCKVDQTDIYTEINEEGSLEPPITTKTTPHYEKYALFFNQKYDFYHFMILPGIRIDYNDISKEFISPSLGFSLNLSDNFILRLTAARGFSAPPISWISEGFWNYDPNPDLKREEVWSYQAGFESTELWFMAIKANYFYHDLDKQMITKRDEISGTRTKINGGKKIRQGLDFEIATKAFYHFIAYGSGAYVYTKNKETNETTNTNSGNIGIRYNDRRTFRFELNGHFQDFNYKEGYYNETDIIWDFTLCKTLKYRGKYQLEFISKIHNIFDGNQFYADSSYWHFDDIRNPHRWVEAGFSLKF